ncbi:MAG: methylated-DNA--[protein]-cysteine S-methyltransferase [Actinomycetales bacterium]
MAYTLVDTPIGPLRVVVEKAAIVAIEFWPDPSVPRDMIGQLPASADRARRRSEGRATGPRQDDHPVLVNARTQLTEYFAGERTRFDLPLAPVGSDFQQRVWSLLLEISYGEVATYGELAGRLGKGPGAARAVGLANGSNPIPIVIPCHRVVGADRSLTGYAGGINRKRALLDLEASDHTLF